MIAMNTKLFGLFIALLVCLPSLAQQKPVEKVDSDGVYLMPDQMPEFPGGMQAMMKFLTTNIKYPVEAQKKGVSGRVIVQFVIMEDGTLDQIVANYIGDDTKGTCPYESPADVDYSNGKLVMATNAAFEPYEFYEGEEVVGIDADIAKAICDKLGYELQIDDMEFDAIISAVQSGKADFGAAGMTVTEDRLTSIDFTDSYATSTQVVIVRK